MIKGADVSHYQGAINFDQLATAIQFVIIKCDSGCPDPGQTSAMYKDPMFETNKINARRAGLAVGIYHFAYPDLNSPEAEADSFATNLAGDVKPGEFLALDFERDTANRVAWVTRFMARMDSHFTGYLPLFYTSESFLKANDYSPVKNHGLWVAKYGINNGSVPTTQPVTTPWSSCAIWQYTSVGKLPGITGNVDLNNFYGTVDQLKKYGLPAPIVTPPPVPEPQPPAPEPTPPPPEPIPVPPAPEPVPPVPPQPSNPTLTIWQRLVAWIKELFKDWSYKE